MESLLRRVYWTAELFQLCVNLKTTPLQGIFNNYENKITVPRAVVAYTFSLARLRA